MTDDDTSTLWIGAFRYYCGQRTYAVRSFCEMLRLAWAGLPEHAKDIIRRDLEEDFVADDAARASLYAFHPLGDDCDRAEWEKVRALWQ